MTEYRFTFTGKDGKRNSLNFKSTAAFEEWLTKLPDSEFKGVTIDKVEAREVTEWETIEIEQIDCGAGSQ